MMNYTCFKSPFGWVGVAKSPRGISRVVFGKSNEAEVEECLLLGANATEVRRRLIQSGQSAPTVLQWRTGGV